MLVQIDMNYPEFQQQLFNLTKPEQLQLLNTLKKIAKLTWTQLYADQGLKWEAIVRKREDKVYTFRFSQKYRVLAIRENNYLRLLNLCVDHDSAYN